jgi:Tfp pilus assembly protein PilV
MRSRQAGFTIVEVMIALLLTAIAIMGIIGLYVTTTRASGFTRHTTEASVLAEDKVEKLRTLTPASSIPTPVTEAGIDPEGKTGTGGIYTLTYTVTIPGGSTFANVQVIVTWVDDAITHTVTVNSRRNLP